MEEKRLIETHQGPLSLYLVVIFLGNFEDGLSGMENKFQPLLIAIIIEIVE